MRRGDLSAAVPGGAAGAGTWQVSRQHLGARESPSPQRGQMCLTPCVPDRKAGAGEGTKARTRRLQHWSAARARDLGGSGEGIYRETGLRLPAVARPALRWLGRLGHSTSRGGRSL